LHAGAHTITAKYNGDATYESSVSPPVIVTINKRGTNNPADGLTVTVQSQSRVFGTANPAFNYRVSGALVSGTYAAAVTGVPVYTVGPPADTPTSPVGSTFPVSVNGLTSANYVLTLVPGTLTIVGAASMTMLTVSPTNLTYGQTLTLTATVTPSAATGAVVFQSGANVSGTATITAGVVTLPTSGFPVGTYELTATYLGDGSYGASTSSPVTVTVNKAPLTVTANNASRLFGAGNPGFSYTVTGTLFNGDTSATAVTGTAAYSTTANTASPASPPTYPITIVGGLSSDNYALTLLPGELTISTVSVVVTLVQSQASSTYGDPVTFTATVAATNPTGTISFQDGGTTISGCGPLIISSGQASCTVNSPAVGPLNVGSHSIKAVYSGDLNYNPGNSDVVGHTVINKATPTLTLALSSGTNPSTYGNPVTFTATGAFAATPPALGRIVFSDNGVIVPACPGQLISGTPPAASCTISTLSVGAHQITASFAGDANYNSATSNTLNHQVTIATPIVNLTLSSGTNPSTYRSSLTFTATVPPDATGTIAFTDNGAIIAGCNTAPAPTATCTTATLPAGSHTITAEYTSTSANYTNATSNGLNQLVTQISLTVTLTAAPSPVIYGETSILTAVLSNTAATGTVTFTATPTAGGAPVVLGTSSLDSTVTAVFPESTLPVGTYNVVARYNGDPNFTANQSSSAPLQVTQRTTPGNQPVLWVVTGNSTRRAGEPNPPFTYSVTGELVNGDTYATAVTGTPDFSAVYSGSTPGTYPISVSGLTSANYLIGYVNGTLTVTPDTAGQTTTTALLAIPTTAEYGSAVSLTATVAPSGPTGTVTFYDGTVLLGTTGLSGGAAILITATLNAGTHAITAQYNGDATYGSSVSQPVMVTINKKGTNNPANGLTVTVQNVSRVFGTANPAFSYVVTGSLVNGDTFATAVTGTPAYAVNDQPASPTGSTFPITIAGGLASANYVLTFAPGTLTIAGAASATSLTASSPVLSYGQEEILTATVSPAGATGTVVFQSGTTVLGTAPVTNRVAILTTSSLPAGTYVITATYLGDANYGASTSATVITITVNQAAALTVTVNDVSRSLGAGNPAFSYTVTGTLVNGDTYATAVTGVPAFTTTAVTSSPAGAYPVSIAGGLVSNNYAVTFVPGTLTVLPAAANQLAFVQQPSNAAAGATITPAVTLQLPDSSGNAVHTSGVAISLHTTSGATLSGTLTQNTDANGIATFADLSIAQAGAYRLQANASNAASATSNAFTITAGPAAVIMPSSGTPQSAIVGTVFGSALVATVTDAAGNPVKGVPVTFVAAGTGASGTFGGQSTIVVPTDAQGHAAAVLTANNTAGSYVVVASADGISGTAEFVLTNLPANAGGLAFVQQPVSTPVGQVVAPPVTVQLQDAAGHPVAVAGVPVVISLSSGTGTLSGTQVRLTDPNGTATFNDLSINQAGTKQLAATAPGQISAASAPFSITGGNAGNIVVFAGSPQTTVVLKVFGTPLQARVTDSLGNPVSGVPVSFLINAGSSGASGTFGGSAGAVTDSNGIATAPVLTANDQTGIFTVTATTPGVSSGAVFSLANLPQQISPIVVSPLILTFTSEIGQAAPPAQIEQIKAATSWTISSSAPWLTASAGGGTGNGEFTVSVNPAGLALGTYTGSIRVSDSAGNFLLTLVSYTITSQPALVVAPPALVFTASSASFVPPPQMLRATSTSRTLSYSASTKVSTPTGGSWLSISATQGQTPGPVSVSVNPAGLQQGIYNGWVLFTPAESGINQVAVPVALLVGCDQGGCRTQPLIIAVVNGASFQTAGAPGAIMTVFGTELSDAIYNASVYPLPTQLGQTTVTVNGARVPLFYASPTQINFQMPSNTDLSNITIAVDNQAPAGGQRLGASSPFVSKLGAVDPGLFRTGNRAAALNQDLTLHTPATPLAAGDYVLLYATGVGPVTPPVPDGAPAPSAPLPLITGAVQVSIGGKGAQVTYQGLAPGFAGLAQLNVIVPAGLMPGDQPVLITINGVVSNVGVITVK
jgi:adhesin/invasin